MQTPHRQERSPWAIVSVLIVVFLFTLFWWWQRSTIPPTPEPVETKQMKQTSNTSFDLRDLEASAATIVIPSFESIF